MDRLSSKHTHLAPLRIFSRLQCLLFLIGLIAINGCAVTRATPDTWNLKIQDDAPLPISNLSLVRRAVPEVGTKSYTGWNFRTNNAAPAVSESRFGGPNEEADLSCVYAGLKKTLPGIDIIPATTFWEQIKAPQDVTELPKLFVGPQSDLLRAIQADVMIIAYHTEIDLETTNMFAGIEAAFSNTVKKTAAIIVIDLNRKTIIHGSKISFKSRSGFGYMMFIPIGKITLEPPDICTTVGSQAGVAIAEAMPGRAIRALVVVAGEDPYGASTSTTPTDDVSQQASSAEASTTQGECQISQFTLDEIDAARSSLERVAESESYLQIAYLIEKAEAAARLPECDDDKAINLAFQARQQAGVHFGAIKTLDTL